MKLRVCVSLRFPLWARALAGVTPAWPDRTWREYLTVGVCRFSWGYRCAVAAEFDNSAVATTGQPCAFVLRFSKQYHPRRPSFDRRFGSLVAQPEAWLRTSGSGAIARILSCPSALPELPSQYASAVVTPVVRWSANQWRSRVLQAGTHRASALPLSSFAFPLGHDSTYSL